MSIPELREIISNTALDITEKFKDSKNVVITIDGCSASGKTTFAENLSDLLSADIIHTDDFFLPQKMKTKDRLDEPGGNIHYERFKEQVIDNLKKPRAFSYEIYNCHNPEEVKHGFCLNKKYTIIEGAYSNHPYFNDYADFKIFLTTDKETQYERILLRNGREMREKFIKEWIPLENRYFEAFDIEKKSDIVFRM